MSLPELEQLSRDDERLRRVAADRRAVEAAAALAEERLREPGADRRRLLGYLGGAYRLLGRHSEAVAAHEEARDLAAASGEPRAHALALVRLGESYRCADRLPEAEAALRDALGLAPPEATHFALQHLGKALLELGDAAAAATALEEALRLRRELGDDELVRSTERALEAARGRG